MSASRQELDSLRTVLGHVCDLLELEYRGGDLGAALDEADNELGRPDPDFAAALAHLKRASDALKRHLEGVVAQG